jgi:hypothetical protein
MRTRHRVGLIVPLLSIAAVVVAANSRRQPAPPGEAMKLIDAPTAWVAFSADYVKGYSGKDEVVGRFMRASNGSDRLESGPPEDPARVVFIHNLARGQYYSKRTTTDGRVVSISGPMSLPADGWKPMQMREERGRHVLLQESVEGRAVLQTGSYGTVVLLAPSLNYHPLVKRVVATGYHELYRHVTVGEPAEDLFEPPPGSEIRHTDTVGGIEVIMAMDAAMPK